MRSMPKPGRRSSRWSRRRSNVFRIGTSSGFSPAGTEAVDRRSEALVTDRRRRIERDTDPRDEPLVMTGHSDVVAFGKRRGEHLGALFVAKAPLHPDLEVRRLEGPGSGGRVARKGIGKRPRRIKGVTGKFEGACGAFHQGWLLGRETPTLEPHLEVLDVPALARVVGEQAAQRLDDRPAKPLAAQEGVIGAAADLLGQQLLIAQRSGQVAAEQQESDGNAEGIEILRRRAVAAPGRRGHRALDRLAYDRLEHGRRRAYAFTEYKRAMRGIAPEEVRRADSPMSEAGREEFAQGCY